MTKEETKFLFLEFSEPKKYTYTIVHPCPGCDLRDDEVEDRLLEEKVDKIIETMEAESHQNVLRRLDELKISLWSICFSLRIPRQTLKEWEEGVFSKEAMVLLRCIAMNPFILERNEVKRGPETIVQ